MIVCATPRSGGTVFGYDKAKELGIPFLNEVVPGNTEPFQFRPTWKNKYHELPCQPILSMKELFDISANPITDKFIILVNGSNSHWLFHQADWFVARRNIKQWLHSVCNFWIKNRQGRMSLDLIQTYLTFTIENGYALYAYCTGYKKEILWYEDLYYRENQYKELFSHPDVTQILSTIERLVEQTKILDTNKHLVYT
jgi:hypothetical protein